jgi:hypothetical protein
MRRHTLWTDTETGTEPAREDLPQDQSVMNQQDAFLHPPVFLRVGQRGYFYLIGHHEFNLNDYTREQALTEFRNRMLAEHQRVFAPRSDTEARGADDKKTSQPTSAFSTRWEEGPSDEFLIMYNRMTTRSR